MILATGHLGRDEIFALVKGAKEMGLRKILVTHAEFPSQNLTGEEQAELADLGAVIEHCFTTTYTGKAEWQTVFENIRRAGTRALSALDRLGSNRKSAGLGRVCDRSRKTCSTLAFPLPRFAAWQ